MKRRLAIQALPLLLLPWFASTASGRPHSVVSGEARHRVVVIPSGTEHRALRVAGCPYAVPRYRVRRHVHESAPPLGPPKIINVVPRDRERSEPSSAAPPVVTGTDQPIESGDPLLWRMDSPTATVYLFGSLPVANQRLLPLDRRVEDAFHSSATLILQSDITPVARVQLQRLLEAYGTYPAAESLDQHVDAELMTKLGASLEQHRLEHEPLLRRRPWYAVLTLTAVAYRNGGFGDNYVIEEHLLRQASGKRVEHVESLAQQADALRGVPEEAQVAALRDTIERFDGLAPELGRIVDAWRAGDIGRLENTSPDPLRKAAPQFYLSVMTSRNNAVAAKIKRCLAQHETAFVVVASSQLIGEGSVLAILAGDGLVAKRL